MTHPGGLVGGRYRLAERIGAGAMGVVWRAHDERLGRTVALKQLVLPAGLGAAEAAEAVERVMREGRIAARLHHPNAIGVFDVTDHDGTPWLVMEYLASRSLATVLAEYGPLPPRDVAEIGRQLADALAAAHAAGIVHRDIKPGNVLLGDGGVAKLTDFGISRAKDDVTVTQTGVLAGTPAYLAPEVARGADPSQAADVFALGATLYTAVEGQPPFGLHDNPIALLHQVAAGRVIPPRQAGPLTALLMSLLRADPAQRVTMAQARDALAGIAAGQAFAPAPAAFEAETMMDLPVGLYGSGQEEASGQRRRPALLVAAGVALAVLAGLFMLAATTGPPERPRAQAPPTTTADSTTVQTTTTTPPPTTTTPPPTAAELQSAVLEYYALLPKHPETAWTRLGPSMQARGYSSYEDFWDGIDAVQAVPVHADAASMTMRVLLVLRRDDRRPVAEVHDLVLIRSGDALLIESDTKIGATAVPTTTRKRGRG